VTGRGVGAARAQCYFVNVVLILGTLDVDRWPADAFTFAQGPVIGKTSKGNTKVSQTNTAALGVKSSGTIAE
jgi:hypothetical protein